MKKEYKIVYGDKNSCRIKTSMYIAHKYNTHKSKYQEMEETKKKT